MPKSFFEKLAASLNLEKDEMGLEPYGAPGYDAVDASGSLIPHAGEEDESADLPYQSGDEEQAPGFIPVLPAPEEAEGEEQEDMELPGSEGSEINESEQGQEWMNETPTELEEPGLTTQIARSSKKPRARLALAGTTNQTPVIPPAIFPDLASDKRKKLTKTPAGKSSLELPEEETEGQLAIDVYQTENDIVVKSTIAGVQAEDFDITIEEDMVTVRGTRKKDEEIPGNQYFYQECYWGPFSRSVILPMEINSEEAQASFKNGVLTICLPKFARHKKKKLAITGA